MDPTSLVWVIVVLAPVKSERKLVVNIILLISIQSKYWQCRIESSFKFGLLRIFLETNFLKAYNTSWCVLKWTKNSKILSYYEYMSLTLYSVYTELCLFINVILGVDTVETGLYNFHVSVWNIRIKSRNHVIFVNTKQIHYFNLKL